MVSVAKGIEAGVPGTERWNLGTLDPTVGQEQTAFNCSQF